MKWVSVSSGTGQAISRSCVGPDTGQWPPMLCTHRVMVRHFPAIPAWLAKSAVTDAVAAPCDIGPAIDKLAPIDPPRNTRTTTLTTRGQTKSLHELVIDADIFAFYHIFPAQAKKNSTTGWLIVRGERDKPSNRQFVHPNLPGALHTHTIQSIAIAAPACLVR